MKDREGIANLLKREPDEAHKHLIFCALLSAAAGGAATPILVVGGSAIEIYAKGLYVSQDIDIVSKHRGRLTEVLGRWGFVRSGRLWVNEEWGLYVDLVSDHYTGAPSKIRTVATPQGPVQVAALEDLIVKRLASAKHWSIPTDVEQAALLGGEFYGVLDWEYMGRQAVLFEVSDLFARLRADLRPARESPPVG